MASRRARPGSAPAATPDLMPASARVAWAYLAGLLALLGAGLVVVLGNQTVANLVCPAATGVDDASATCRLGLAIWLGIAGFLACLAPILLLLKLDWWLWATLAALAGLLVAVDAADQWWWWLLAALLPASAALASADWQRGEGFRRRQRAALLALVVLAAAALVWWFFQG